MTLRVGCAAMGERQFDVVLFGATSFVGRLTAAYLKRAAPAGARIALAGRSAERLAELRGSLGVEWPTLVADTQDAASLAELAASTSVLATTVGPYRRYGIPVVEACAQAGTHYADLTGEVVFMRESIDRFGDAAKRTGARIVHSCGFDSIPSDLGVWLLHEAAKADGAGDLERTTLVVRSVRGGVSGGTHASIKGMIEDRKREPALGRLMDDPYALSPDRAGEPELGAERDLLGVARDELTGAWVGPFVMAQLNTRVVRRSNALLGWSYGRSMRYAEVQAFGGGPLAPALAAGTAAGLGAMLVGLQFAPSAALLDRVLPAPGEGPSERTRDRGHFRIETHTRTSTGARYVCEIAAQGDPGYKATAVMFGESALSLAFDGERLPATGGVLTPATALGASLAERLRAAGQTYEVRAARRLSDWPVDPIKGWQGSAGARARANARGGPAPSSEQPMNATPATSPPVAPGETPRAGTARAGSLPSREVLWLVGLTALALALRVTSLSRSLFNDETVSFALSERGFGHMLGLFGWEANGTPYPVVLWPVTRIFGTGVAVLRAPAVVVGVASVPAIYWAAKGFIDDRRVWLLSAALLALNPMAVFYSQVARSYAFVVLGGCLAFGALLRATEQPSRRGMWALYVVAMALLAYSDLLAPWVILPAQLLIAWREKRQGVTRMVGALLAAGVLCIPLMIAALISHGRRDALYWLPHLNRALVELGLQEFSGGFSGVTAVRWLTLLTGVVLLGAATFVLVRGERWRSREGETLLVAGAWGCCPLSCCC